MKKFLTIATFLTLIATPAFAQSFDPDNGTGNITPPLVMNQGGESTYAYAPGDYATKYSRARKTHTTANKAVRNSKPTGKESSEN